MKKLFFRPSVFSFNILHMTEVMSREEYEHRAGEGTLPEGPVMQSIDLRPCLRELRVNEALFAKPKGSVERILEALGNKLRRWVYDMPPPDERFGMEC